MTHTKLNMNDFAVDVCIMEGGAINLSIAQIKQVMRCVRKLIRDNPDHETVWDRYVRGRVDVLRPKKPGPKPRARKRGKKR